MGLASQELGLPDAKLVRVEKAVCWQVHQRGAADPAQVAVHAVVQDVHGLPQELLETSKALHLRCHMMRMRTQPYEQSACGAGFRAFPVLFLQDSPISAFTSVESDPYYVDDAALNQMVLPSVPIFDTLTSENRATFPTVERKQGTQSGASASHLVHAVEVAVDVERRPGEELHAGRQLAVNVVQQGRDDGAHRGGSQRPHPLILLQSGAKIRIEWIELQSDGSCSTMNTGWQQSQYQPCLLTLGLRLTILSPGELLLKCLACKRQRS